MFDGFALERVDLGEVPVRVRHGGVGTPVVCCTGTRARTPPGTRWHLDSRPST